MFDITCKTGREVQVRAAHAALDFGAAVAPRGFMTKELRPGIFRITNPRDTLPTGIGRPKLHAAIGVAEGLQLIAGVSYPDLMVRVAKKFADFINPDTKKFDGAYGVRAAPQLEHVVDRLQKDPDTRQAILVIYAPEDTHSRPSSLDYPCTLTLHFLIRDGKLCLHTCMRSNDIWLGLPYDIFQFTMLQLSVANILGIEVGDYTHVANSLHLYEHNWDAVQSLVHPRILDKGAPNSTVPLEDFHIDRVNGIGREGDTLEEVRFRANSILLGHQLRNPTETEIWCQEQLAPYV